MKHECAMIVDLLPLYADEVCSEESRKAVEEHLLECECCRNALEQMRAEIPQEAIPDFSEQEVLKKTTWTISKRAIAAAAGVTAIVLYWLVYFWQEALASIGDYRYFSSGLHELYALGYALVPMLSVVWLIVLLRRAQKTKAWHKNAALLLILGLLTVGQIAVWHWQTQTRGMTCVSQVVEIPDQYHVVIETVHGNVTLETTPVVTELLRTDGTDYVFSYQYMKHTPLKGTLNYISQIDEIDDRRQS